MAIGPLITLSLLSHTSSIATETSTPAPPAPAPTAPSSQVVADDPGPGVWDHLREIQVHGFISQGALKSSANNFLGKSKRGTFALSEIGLNFTKEVLEDLRAGVQLFARHLDGNGDFSAKFDWFYLDYRFADWLGISAGRLKTPIGLYNEFNDVDAGRVPILLPNGVYPINNRDYLLAEIGAEIYGYLPTEDFGSLGYRFYGGTFAFDPDPIVQDGFKLDQFESAYVFGGRINYETPLSGLRLAASAQTLRLDIGYVAQPGTAEGLKMAGLAPADFDGRVSVKIPVQIWILSAEYTRGDFLLAAEYGRWHVRIDSNLSTLLPPRSTVREHFYVMGSYRFGDWLWPGLYYSALFPDITDRGPQARHQHDLAATLRFDFNAYWLLKLEAHYLSGTAYLEPAKNDGVALDQLTRNWWLFVAKTTLYF
jgi:hypothetical protein